MFSEEIALQLQEDEMTLHQTEYQPQVVNDVTMTTQTQQPQQSRRREQSNVSTITTLRLCVMSLSLCSVYYYEIV